jgi:anti-anti-sigma factor
VKIAQKLVGDVAVLQLNGRLDLGQADEALNDTIRDLVSRGCLKLVLDLKDVSHLDTTCLGLLIAAYVRLGRQGGGVKLLGTPARIREVLTIAKLDQVLITYDSEERAVRSFSRAAGI